MPTFKNCTFDNYAADGISSEMVCEVRIEPGSITISYKNDGGFVVYEGPEVAPGHYKLTAPSVKGRATLHRFPNDDVLEGFWVENGYEGMWRVFLEELEIEI